MMLVKNHKIFPWSWLYCACLYS